MTAPGGRMTAVETGEEFIGEKNLLTAYRLIGMLHTNWLV